MVDTFLKREDQTMRTIQLKGSPLDDLAAENPSETQWYFGCGFARLALLDGKPVGLLYDKPMFDYYPTEFPAHDEVLYGIVSCWEFCGE